ncbi:MAG: protein kinase, partial [Phycisphaerales bacterium]|nr:protein kinase [Phycisphaerales bacterium]
GSGGMADVFEAEDEHGERVAIKMLRATFAGPEALKRFHNEREALASLDHPAIARVFGAGTFRPHARARGVPYFIMELIRGENLVRFADERSLDDHARMELVAAVCDGVQHAHDAGVIHRDLKPGNILVESSGQPRIVDFGIARVVGEGMGYTTLRTNTGQVMGTVPYMSPEQISGQGQVDEHTDIYALGVILFELLIGRVPFDLAGCSLPQAARIVQEDEPPSAGSIERRFRGEVETILHKVLAKEPGRRYASAAELAADIRRHLDRQPITARPPSSLYQLRRFARRNRPLVATVITTFLALVIGLILTLAFAMRESDLRRVAESSRAAARESAYQATLTAARFALLREDTHLARAVLLDAPEESRNWEWQHLMARTDSTIVSRPCEGGLGRALQIAWGDDGAPLMLVRDDEGAAIIELPSGARRHGFPVPADVLATSVSPDGRLVGWLQELDADTRSRVRVCDAGGHVLLDAEIPGRLRARVPLRFGPNGRHLGVVTTAGLHCFDLESGELVLFAPGMAVFELTDHMVLCRGPKKSVRRYDLETGAEMMLESSRSFQSFAADPSGRSVVLVAHESDEISLFDGRSGELVSESGDGGLPALCISDDGRWFAAVAEHGIRIRDLQIGEWVQTLALDGQPRWGCFAADSRRLLVQTDAEVVLLDLDMEAIATLEVGGFVYGVAWNSTGTMLATSPLGGEVAVWDAITGETLVAGPGNPGPGAVSFSPDDEQLLWMRRRVSLQMQLGSGVCTKGEHLGDDAFRDRASDFLTLCAGDSRVTFAHDGEGAVLSRDREYIVTRASSTVRVQRRTGETVQEFEVESLQSEEYPGCTVAISPDNQRIAIAGRDGSIEVWSVSGTRLIVFPAEPHERFSLAFSPDRSRIAAATRPGVVEIWDAETGALRMTLEGHSLYVYSVAFSPDGTRLATASGDGTVRIWDTRPAQERDRTRRDWLDARRRAAAVLADQAGADAGDLNRVKAPTLDRSAMLAEIMRRLPPNLGSELAVPPRSGDYR